MPGRRVQNLIMLICLLLAIVAGVPAKAATCSTDPNNPQATFINSTITIRAGEIVTKKIRAIDNDGYPGNALQLVIGDLNAPSWVSLGVKTAPDPNKVYPAGATDCSGNALDSSKPTISQAITISPPLIILQGTYSVKFSASDGIAKSYWTQTINVLPANQPPCVLGFFSE